MLGFARKQPAQSSAGIALGRLQMVLVADRMAGSAQILELMKNDIIDVIRKYIDIDETDLDIQIVHGAGSASDAQESRLRADIPIKSIKRLK